MAGRKAKAGARAGRGRRGQAAAAAEADGSGAEGASAGSAPVSAPVAAVPKRGAKRSLAFPALEDGAVGEIKVDDDSASARRPADSSNGAPSSSAGLADVDQEEVDAVMKDVHTKTSSAAGPTRGQRWVFKQQYMSLDPTVRAEYDRIKLSTTPGKQKLLDNIVMEATKHVTGYQGTLDTRDATWRHYLVKSDTTYSDDKAIGYTLTEIKSMLKELFEPGLANGDVLVQTDQNGKDWYYMRRREMGHKKEAKNQQTLSQTQVLETTEEKVHAILDMSDTDWVQWANNAIGAGGAGSSTDPAPASVTATEQTMSKAQQGYDALNSSILSVKKVLLGILGKVDASTTNSARERCNAAMPVLSDLEGCLYTPKEDQKDAEVKKKLLAAAKEYQIVKMKELELSGIKNALDKAAKEEARSSAA